MPLWKLRLFARLQNAEPGAGGGGNANPPATPPGNTPPAIPADLMPAVQALIDAQVLGLKNKNSELINAQKGLKTQLDTFEGIDPVAVRAILTKFSSEEEAELIAKGKIDEVLTKRTERLSADWQKKVDTEITKGQKLTAANQRLAARALSEAISKAAIKAGALPEAIEDITLRAKGAGWLIDDEGNPVAKAGDDIVIGKDGKTALTPTEWAESLRETAPHLWPRAQGSGAPGSNGGKAFTGDLSKFTPEERISRFRESQAAH